MIKRFLLSLSLVVLSLSCSAAENATAEYAAGTHYDVVSPAARTASGDKVEVVEFFWYGCGHCYSFEPMVQQWKKSLPEDVAFRGVPAVWAEAMGLHAQAYYAAESLGVSDTMNAAMFQAMNVDQKRLTSQADIAKLFSANGVSAEDFDKAFTSFGVSSQVKQGISLAKAAQITGTPALLVNGKYHVSARKAGGQAEMLKVVDFLIAKERAAKGS
jgi:thiol:disulfide interchange protein DsbA